MKLTPHMMAALAIALSLPFVTTPAGPKRTPMRRSIKATRSGDRITYLHATKGWRSRRFPKAVRGAA